MSSVKLANDETRRVVDYAVEGELLVSGVLVETLRTGALFVEHVRIVIVDDVVERVRVTGRDSTKRKGHYTATLVYAPDVDQDATELSHDEHVERQRVPTHELSHAPSWLRQLVAATVRDH